MPRSGEHHSHAGRPARFSTCGHQAFNVRAHADDPQAGAAEFGGEFRRVTLPPSSTATLSCPAWAGSPDWIPVSLRAVTTRLRERVLEANNLGYGFCGRRDGSGRVESWVLF